LDTGKVNGQLCFSLPQKNAGSTKSVSPYCMRYTDDLGNIHSRDVEIQQFYHNSLNTATLSISTAKLIRQNWHLKSDD
jgi:hypothetical protein